MLEDSQASAYMLVWHDILYEVAYICRMMKVIGFSIGLPTGAMRYILLPHPFHLSGGRTEEDHVHSSGNRNPNYSVRNLAAWDFMNLLMY